jgi:drug/metabolite transporter (DMT)-like permease
MLLSTFCFTSNVLLVRALSELHFGNVWLVSCVRFLVGLVIVATLYRREWQPLHLFTNSKLIERGVVGGIGVYVTYLAVVKLGAGRAIFISNTYVVWAALFAAWLLREHLPRVVIFGSVIALTGLGLLTNVFSALSRPGFYDGVAVLSALFAAYVVVTIRQLHASEHSSTIFSAQCFYGLLICAGPAIWQLHALPPLPLLLLLLASLTAGAGQLTMTRAFRDLNVAEGSLLQMLVPIGIAISGMIFFRERFRPMETLGAALILAGTSLPALWRPASRVTG